MSWLDTLFGRLRIRVAGVDLPEEGALNFASGATGTDNPSAGSTDIDISGSGGGTAGGDLSGTYPNPSVEKIHGATVPTAGALTAGNVLKVSGASALTYGAVNLAGGANHVTGTLPTGNQAAQSMGGDCSGTTAACVIEKITGATNVVKISAALSGDQSTPTTLKVGAAVISMSSDANLTLTSAQCETPWLRFTSSVSLTATRTISAVGVVSGTFFFVKNSTTGGQSLLFKAGAGTGPTIVNGAAALIVYDGTDFVSLGAVGATAAGDLSGTYPNPTVAKVNGTTYGAGGSLTTGQVPRVTGASTTAYGALDLANTSAVTGVLPAANVDPAASGAPIANALLTFNTSNGTADVTAYTVPASPTGSARFVLTRVVARIETAITGGGNVVLRMGSTTGGAEFVTDSAAFTSGTGTAGVTHGRKGADQGASMLATEFYEAELAAGATVKARATTAGGGISGGTARIYVYGYFLP